MVKQRINMWNLLLKEKDWIICNHSLCCYTSAKEVGDWGEGVVIWTKAMYISVCWLAHGNTFHMEENADWTRFAYGLCAVRTHWLATSR